MSSVYGLVQYAAWRGLVIASLSQNHCQAPELAGTEGARRTMAEQLLSRSCATSASILSPPEWAASLQHWLYNALLPNAGPRCGLCFRVTHVLGESQGVLLDWGLDRAASHLPSISMLACPGALCLCRAVGALCLRLQLFRGLAQLTRCWDNYLEPAGCPQLFLLSAGEEGEKTFLG